MIRLDLTVEQAMNFAALPMPETSATALLEAASRVSASPMPEAYMYQDVWMYDIGDLALVRVRISKVLS